MVNSTEKQEKEKLVQLCQDLIRINSENPPGNENGVIDYCATYLMELGADIKIIKHALNRSSLIAKWKGIDDSKQVLLVGHVDTVPFGDTKKWMVDPLSGEIQENKIYGRGASDMKGGVAAMLQALTILKGENQKKSVVLALTADEECKGLGAKSLLDADLNLAPEVVIIPEPTNNHIAVAEKGTLWLEIQTRGIPAHASMPELGVNAVDKMARIIRELDLSSYVAEKHEMLGAFTASFTQIQGGEKANIIPEYCEAQMDIRFLPKHASKEIRNEIQKQVEEILGVDYTRKNVKILTLIERASIETDCNLPIMQAIINTIKDINKKAEIISVPYFTDAAEIVPFYDVPFLICGPGIPGLAHAIDENVEIEKLYQSYKIYRRLIDTLTVS